MARTIQTHELISFSIQEWTQGQRWGDAFGGDVGGCLTNPKMSRGISGR